MSYSAQEVQGMSLDTDGPVQTPEVPEVQGGDVTTGGLDLYDLQSAPEELREALVPILKDIEGNVGRKFQEAAEFRKTWEPYAELGLSNLPVEEAQALIAFRDIAADEEQFAAWHSAVGVQLAENAPPVPTEPPDPMQTEIAALREQLNGVTGRLSKQDEDQRLTESAAFVRSTLDQLKTEHGEFNEDAVLKLTLAHDGEDAIQKAFADYQSIVGSAQSGLLERKLDEPDTPGGPGTPATAAAPVTSYEEARQVALGRLRQQ